MGRCIKKPDVNKLDKRVVIQKFTTTRSSGGARVRTWVTRTKAWMQLEPLNSREEYVSMQLETKTTHKAYMRYNGTVIEKDRVLWSGRYFSIVGIKNIGERNAFLELMLVETEEAGENG